MNRFLKGIFLIIIVICSYFIVISYKTLTTDYEKRVLLGGTSIGIRSDKIVRNNNENITVNTSEYSAGTLTYIDPEDNSFGALGHTYTDNESSGYIYYSYVIDNIKSVNEIGHKIVSVDYNSIIGYYNKDSEVGIFGDYYYSNKSNYISIGMPKSIKLDKAYIATVINDDKIEYFEIEIRILNYSNKKTNIYFTIIDERLLNETNGLIGGMSGSPIIQNGKLIGAVSSANKYNYKKGYGVFITNMIKK